MFNRVIRKSASISSIFKFCNNNTYTLQKNEKLDLRFISSNKRYLNTSCLFYYQEYPKENNIENSNGVKLDHNQLKKNNTETENKEDSQKTTEGQDNKQSNNSKDSSKKRRRLFEGDLVLHSFANTRKKEKDTYLECLRMYQNQPGRKRERVPFIYAALKHMEEFNVHKDLSVYKALLNIFPKESMIPTNIFQTMYLHYPKEQYCAVAVLEQMEDNGVMPDAETELILLNIFGRHGMPLEKYWKMMYWMPKFKNLNPWPVPSPIPNDALELAKLAMIKISSIDVESVVSTFDTNDIQDSIDKTWIVSAMAPKQSELLLEHDKNHAIYVEGPFKIYVATKSVDYFILRANPTEKKYPDYDIYYDDAVDKLRNPYLETKTVDVILPPSVHEQDDATIFAICATGMSSKDSLLSWVRFLEKSNPILAEIPIVFTLKNYSEEKLYLGDGRKKQVSYKSDNDKNDKFLN